MYLNSANKLCMLCFFRHKRSCCFGNLLYVAMYRVVNNVGYVGHIDFCQICFVLHVVLCFVLHVVLCFVLHVVLCFVLHVVLCFVLHVVLCFVPHVVLCFVLHVVLLDHSNLFAKVRPSLSNAHISYYA